MNKPVDERIVTSIRPYRRPFFATQPPYLYPAYRSTVKRAPTQPLPFEGEIRRNCSPVQILVACNSIVPLSAIATDIMQINNTAVKMDDEHYWEQFVANLQFANGYTFRLEL